MSESEYAKGYAAGIDNAGTWGGESDEWMEGFVDGTERRIADELAAVGDTPNAP